MTTAQQKITDLADQTAKAGDDVAFAKQQIANLYELAALGGSVSVALNRCVNDQKTLIGYLQNSAKYNASEVAQFKSSVDALCAAAQSANAGVAERAGEVGMRRILAASVAALALAGCGTLPDLPPPLPDQLRPVTLADP